MSASRARDRHRGRRLRRCVRRRRGPRSTPPTDPGRAQPPDGAARHARGRGTDDARHALRLHAGCWSNGQAGRRGVRPAAGPGAGDPAAHVGGGFGAKGTPRPHVILAGMAARTTGRPVKLRGHPAADVRGHPPPGPVRSSGCASAPPGRQLTALCHDVIDQTSTLEFTEQSAVAAPARCTPRAAPADHPPRGPVGRAHAVLDARAGGVPGHVRAGIGPGRAGRGCGIDPVELRLRNEPAVHPETGPAVLQPPPDRLPARGRRAVRPGPTATRPRHAP